MNVGRKLMMIVITSVALVSIPSAAGIYYFAKQKMLASEATTLEGETKVLVASNTQHLMEADPSLKALSRMLEKALSASPKAREDVAFDSLVQRDSDRAWRSRRKSFDGRMEAGMFLPPDAPLDAEQKKLHLRSKGVMDIFGSSIHSPFSNVWLLTPGKTEIIYDHGVPDFALIMSADTDYTKTPWLTLGDSATNPERGLRWTPPLFDPVPKSWMVSAVLPVDVNGRWIGTIGHDIYLNNVFPALFQKGQRYMGEQHFLLDAQGNYLEAGPWQKALEAKPENFKPDLRNEPDLIKLLGYKLDSKPHAFEEEVSLQGRKYLAIGTNMQPIGWHYFRLVPIDEILAPMRHLFYVLVAMVLMVGLFIGLLIDAAVERNIIKRLQALANAVRRYGLGELNVRARLTGDDEIAKTSNEFDAMADHLKATLDAIPDLLFELGLDGRYYAAHTPHTDLLALPQDELIGKTVQEMLPSEASVVVISSLQEAYEKGWSQGKQFELQVPQGKLWFELSVAKKSTDDDQNPRFIVLSRDITERKLAADDLRIAAIAFESQEGMFITDFNCVILRVNHAFNDITGYTAEEAIGQTPRLLSSGQHDAAFYAAMWESVNKTGKWGGEIWNRRKNGEIYPQHLTITAVKGAGGIVTNYVGTFTDITMIKAAEEEIQQLAFYDPLTDLPNRRLLLDRLNRALAASARSSQQGAVLFLDLDNFKMLNDSLGHDIGDLLLQQVAERLTAFVRESDTVARLGGDEFVVILENLGEHDLEAAAQAETITNKILTALNQPYLLSRYEYHSTVSVGVAVFNDHQVEIEELLKQADIAMYQAKKAGRNTMRFFNPQMQNAIHSRLDLERELRKALEQQQFQLHYQIQVDNLGHPLGAEVLIRWLHPERGLVSPFHFIPLAEETGLILPIGQWILDTACAQLKAWQQNAHTRNLTLSINVSAKQFHQVDFVAQINNAVQHYCINPMRLKLELTESMLLDNIDSTIATMNALKELGIRFSLDDFGTGYSSLQYLKRLPLYQLKIDQSFVRDIAADSSDQAIVRTIIAMAHTLNLNVIAEGVETEEQRQLLLNAGCAHYQGYLFGKPAPIAQFEAVLEAGLISNEVVLCA